jgi:hypothetical protein
MPLQIDNQTLSLIISERIGDLDLDSFSPTDWELLVRKAQTEGVAPLVYWVLSRSGKFSSILESVHHSLRSMYSSVWKQNQEIFKELEVLTRLFDQAEIPLVVLKGACFALTIYPDIGLRPMGDLDLLVPASKLSEAVRIAKTLGYVDIVPEASPGLGDLLGHAIFLQKTGVSSITLELHNSLVADKSYTYAVPVDWFWSQTESFVCDLSKTRFNNLRMLTPTAQILYAASHAMLQHGGKNTSLCWFYDLDRLIRFYAERVDWNLLLSQAKDFEWGSALDAALSQTYTYFNTPIPGHVRASLSEGSDRNRKLVALMQIHPATHMLEERQKLMALNGYGRLRLALALIAPSPSYMRWRYQLQTSWVLPAYYIFRWWGIFKDVLHTIVSLFQKTRPVERQATESAPPKNGS